MEKCPVCSQVLPNLSGLRPGRPPKYCSRQCRRRAERRARWHKARVLWAKKMLTLTPAEETALAAFWGRDDLEQRALLEADV